MRYWKSFYARRYRERAISLSSNPLVGKAVSRKDGDRIAGIKLLTVAPIAPSPVSLRNCLRVPRIVVIGPSIREEFVSHMVGHGTQSIKRDFFHIDAAHSRDCVAHDAMDSVLVVCLVGPGAKGVTKRVKAEALPMQIQISQHAPECNREPIGLRSFHGVVGFQDSLSN